MDVKYRKVKLFYIFSLFVITIGSPINQLTTIGNHRSDTDGELFVKRIVDGEKFSNKPSYLLFTAPYRLCKGGCNSTDNFVFAFPLYIGNKGKVTYQNMYRKDYKNVYSKNVNAPFRKKTKRKPITPCPTLKLEVTNNVHSEQIPENSNTLKATNMIVEMDETSILINFENTTSLSSITKTDSNTVITTESMITTTKHSKHSNTAYENTMCPKISSRNCKKRKPSTNEQTIYNDDVKINDYKVVKNDVNKILRNEEVYLNFYELS
ncbi:uncharacterized protein LOC131841815 [Achroia grisella]|uniref:uncharacterized protein LOC131841815 n=1 Tax=Achroia grisella TaxID=688607 RepID=UPI0027D30B0B|nr:uncharacterized protein LOC131841815 [Achroia grisella]